jgi:hypothetical protein
MWKPTSVQVCNDRGTINTAIGVVSRLSVADGWEFEVGDVYVIATKGDMRLRLPASAVCVEERCEVEPAKPAKRKRPPEAA